jgi:hypothetical protein
LVAVVCGLPSVSAAQDEHRVGVTMGYPASVGVLWHVSRRVAVRPEFSFTKTSNEFTSALDTTTLGTASAVGVGVSGIFYLRQMDKLRTYVSPRFTYTRSTTTTEGSGVLNASRGTGNGYSAIGAFGAQYALSGRFSLFGEVGAGYSGQKSSSDSGSFGSTSVSHTWASRTGIGVVLYF